MKYKVGDIVIFSPLVLGRCSEYRDDIVEFIAHTQPRGARIVEARVSRSFPLSHRYSLQGSRDVWRDEELVLIDKSIGMLPDDLFVL